MVTASSFNYSVIYLNGFNVMSSGKVHTNVTYGTVPVVGLISYFYTGDPSLALSVALGCTTGLWLNPDLDIERSMPTQRWKEFAFIWRPYQKLFHHHGNFFRRNFWTHCPIVGMSLRVWPLVLILFYLEPTHAIYTAYGLIGLLVNDCVHLICDISKSYIGAP